MAMRVLVAGATSEMQYVEGVESFYGIVLREGDDRTRCISGRGDVSRRTVCDEFLRRTEFDAVLMVDMDQLSPPNLLEKLRAHDLDMVTAHYMHRSIDPPHSICSEIGDDTWPYPVMTDVPESGLHEIALSGMGAVLIRREVIEAVRNYLPAGDHPFAIGPLREVAGDDVSFPAKYRFFTIARKLGYKLWLDADIECLHATVVWVGRDIQKRLGGIYTPPANRQRALDGSCGG